MHRLERSLNLLHTYGLVPAPGLLERPHDDPLVEEPIVPHRQAHQKVPTDPNHQYSQQH